MFSLFEIIFFLLMGYALFFALCMAATGIPPFPVIGKTKRIRELKGELRRLKALEERCYNAELSAKYIKRIIEIEDLIQKEIDKELGINQPNKNSPWE